MNESFMRKIYEAGPELDENMMQQGLNFQASSSRTLSRPFRARMRLFSLQP